MLYTVHNDTRKCVLAHSTERAETSFSRLKGLLGRDGLKDGTGLHIVPCNSIHTFFMRFPIDAAFLDDDEDVVHIVHAMPPWRATRMFFSARSVLELPAGTLARAGTQIGDRLRFEPHPVPDAASR